MPVIDPDDVLVIARNFLKTANEAGFDFFNEAELQHELGYWLRANLPGGTRVYFERPASSFFRSATGIAKKEIDLALVSEGDNSHFAIEIKCPRNGRVPETMYDSCKDIQFLEQLNSHGFSGGLFILHVNDPLFYCSGSQSGIYSFFRAGTQMDRVIPKPTGKTPSEVKLAGIYKVDWNDYGNEGSYWLQKVTAQSTDGLR